MTLTDPAGTVVTPAPATDATAPVIAAADPASPVTLVGLRKPKPGTWTIQAAAGSPAIASIGQGRALSPPKITARPGGKGRARTLRYTVSGPPGTTVTFAEVAAGGEHPIGTATRPSGTLRFTPSGGRGGKRAIVADIAVNGVGFARRTVGSYVAPSPRRPGKPRGRVSITRRGTSVTVRFGRSTGATGYAVTLTSSDRTKRLRILAARTRSIRFTNVHAGTRLSVRVQGVGPDGRRGTAATATRR